jgi:hypothetical protein
MDMVPVYFPQSESEAAVVTALMQAYEIHFHIRGGAFSAMYPGTVSTALNEKVLMVAAEQAQLARKLLESLAGTEDEP